MNFNICAQYKAIKLHKPVLLGGEKYIKDPYRQKLVKLTPEEVVRQKTVRFLEQELKVPLYCIRLEQSMRHYQVNSNIRADIVIEGQRKRKNEVNPIAVVECKAEYVALTEPVVQQAMDYADSMGCDYIFLTNGVTMRVGKWVEEKKVYLWLEKLPTYVEMCQGKFKPVQQTEPFVRAPFGQWEQAIEECYRLNEFGKDTPKKMLPFMINLRQCLLDVSHTLPKRQYRLFEVLEDWGNRELSFGNHSGGSYYGLYRSFLIRYKRQKIIVSFGFNCFGTSTILCVGIEERAHSHHSLQLSMDKNLLCHGNRFQVTHSGRIGVGNIGSGKIEELRKGLEKCYPDILVDNKIVLGTLINDRLFYHDDAAVVTLMENLISYALVRDEYREYLIRRNKRISNK